MCFVAVFTRDNGTEEAAGDCPKFGMKIVLAGTIQDKVYFNEKVTPHLDNNLVRPTMKQWINLPGISYWAALMPFCIRIHSVEPSDLSIVESMACGTPVVALQSAAMAEFVRDGETGYLADGVEDALKKLKQIPQH